MEVARTKFATRTRGEKGQGRCNSKRVLPYSYNTAKYQSSGVNLETLVHSSMAFRLTNMVVDAIIAAFNLSLETRYFLLVERTLRSIVKKFTRSLCTALVHWSGICVFRMENGGIYFWKRLTVSSKSKLRSLWWKGFFSGVFKFMKLSRGIFFFGESCCRYSCFIRGAAKNLYGWRKELFDKSVITFRSISRMWFAVC